MKITLNNNIRYKKFNGVSANPREFASKNNQTHFTGSPITTFEKVVSKGNFVSYSNAEKLTEAIDGAIGGNYFSKILKKSGARYNDQGALLLDDASFLKDAWKTIKYPLLDFPRDIINAGIKVLRKVPALKDTMDKVQNFSLLSRRANTVEMERNADIVRDILDNFVGVHQKADKQTYNIKRCAENFSKKVASNITETFKKYSSRDERTLNRAATATVSALYGASDFYNISMLQKDDKGEAKQAGKARFKQEMTRMALNAGMVFFSLGAMDKYIKHSTPLTVATIVGSSFISEVTSRILNRVSLKPLTPDEAAKIAKAKAKKEENNTQINKESNNTKTHNQGISFKNNIENKIYASFAQNDKTLPALNQMMSHTVSDIQSQGEEPKKEKKFGFKEGLGLSFLGASAIYLASYFLKGNYSEGLAKNKFVRRYQGALNNLVHGNAENIPTEVIEKLQKGRVTEPNKYTSKIVPAVKNILGIPRKMLDKITTSKQEVKIQDLMDSVNKLKAADAGNEIAPILDEYQEMLTKIKEAKGDVITLDVDRKMIAVPLNGLINGVKKLFNVVWRVLSTPGMLVKSFIETKTFKKTNDIFAEAASGFKTKSNKKQVLALYDIFKNQNLDTPEGVNKVVEKIVDKTRHFNAGSETSEIANYSRAFVTMIGSYFFVNDYYNKVLIESGGKNIKEANEERNERIAHKLSNFIINGTLMNVFNTTFNKQLNNSLLQATLIATATELTNEAMVRKSICQPIGPKGSRQEIIDWEQQQTSKKGIMGAWSRFFRKITGKKVLTEKAGIDVQKENKDKTQKA